MNPPPLPPDTSPGPTPPAGTNHTVIICGLICVFGILIAAGAWYPTLERHEREAAFVERVADARTQARAQETVAARVQRDADLKELFVATSGDCLPCPVGVYGRSEAFNTVMGTVGRINVIRDRRPSPEVVMWLNKFAAHLLEAAQALGAAESAESRKANEEASLGFEKLKQDLAEAVGEQPELISRRGKVSAP